MLTNEELHKIDDEIYERRSKMKIELKKTPIEEFAGFTCPICNSGELIENGTKLIHKENCTWGD